jgi:hypothetical protein
MRHALPRKRLRASAAGPSSQKERLAGALGHQRPLQTAKRGIVQWRVQLEHSRRPLRRVHEGQADGEPARGLVPRQFYRHAHAARAARQLEAQQLFETVQIAGSGATQAVPANFAATAAAAAAAAAPLLLAVLVGNSSAAALLCSFLLVRSGSVNTTGGASASAASRRCIFAPYFEIVASREHDGLQDGEQLLGAEREGRQTARRARGGRGQRNELEHVARLEELVGHAQGVAPVASVVFAAALLKHFETRISRGGRSRSGRAGGAQAGLPRWGGCGGGRRR